ncbi:MAG: coiled-coil domain-containing protein [Methylohalobius sp.]
MAMPLDTHKLVKRFKEAGFTEVQAETLAEAGAELLETHLATRQDLEAAKGDLKNEIHKVRVDLENKIENVRVDLENKIEKVRFDLETRIEKLRVDLENKIEKLRIDLENKIERLEYRMTIKLGSLMVIAVGVVATLVKLL